MNSNIENLYFENLHVSSGIDFFKNQILKTHKNLKLRYDINKPCVFFGIYNNIDVNLIRNHKSYGMIIFGGSDVLYKFVYKFLKELDYNRFVLISQSKWITQDLKKYGLKSYQVPWYSLDKSKFTPTKKGNKIYAYCPNSNPSFYRMDIIEKIKSLTEYDIIIGDGTFDYSKMPNIYSQCFIGLRLLHHDGLGSTVQELGLMGIKCVHNGNTPSGISYKHTNDILNAINNEAKSIGTTDYKLAASVDKFLTINSNFFKLSNYFKNTIKHNKVTKFQSQFTQLIHVKNSNSLHITKKTNKLLFDL